MHLFAHLWAAIKTSASLGKLPVRGARRRLCKLMCYRQSSTVLSGSFSPGSSERSTHRKVLLNVYCLPLDGYNNAKPLLAFAWR